MRNLYFAHESLVNLVVPRTLRHLVMEGRFPSDLAVTPWRLSLRAGHRDYEVGEDIRAVSDIGAWHLPLRITEVVHKTFGEITDDESIAAGFSSAAEVVDPQLGLPRFYEIDQYDFSPEGDVTIISFELAFPARD